MTEEEMVGWHHQLDGLEFEQAPGVDDGQGGLVCCSLWVTKSQTRLSDFDSTFTCPIFDGEFSISNGPQALSCSAIYFS